MQLEDGCSPSTQMNKAIFLKSKGKIGAEKFPRPTEGISTDRCTGFHKTQILDELLNGSQQELEHLAH